MQRRWLSKMAVVASFALLACALPEHGGPRVDEPGGDSPGSSTGGNGPTAGGSTSGDHAGGFLSTGGSSIGATRGSSMDTTGGSSEAGASTGSVAATGGSISTGGTPETGGATSANSNVTPDAGTTTHCAGLCEVTANDGYGYFDVPKNTIFAYRGPQIISGLTIVGLGAVTNMDPLLMVGSHVHFQLGIYDELNRAPNKLLASTNMLTAQDVSSPVEGAITPIVTTGSDTSTEYWIIMAVDGTSDAFLEAYGVGQTEGNFFAYLDCLPLATTDCPMPTLNRYPYKPIGVTTPSFVPLLYARYLSKG